MKPLLLIIRDGWGENPDPSQDSCNAIKLAHTPCADTLSQNWPRTELEASAEGVGLPHGVIGNSEVGHQNIGAGRIVDQELVRIEKAFASGELTGNPALKHLFKVSGKLHMMGLLSDGGVHSQITHLYKLLEMAKKAGAEEVFIHAFTDGRDTGPDQGLRYIQELQDQIAQIGIGKIATISGRYYAMDRDERWDRVQKAHQALTGQTTPFPGTPADCIEHYYQNPTAPSLSGDEFITPTLLLPGGAIEPGDGVLFFNYRGDRPRELVKAFTQEDFNGFNRPHIPLTFVTLTEYATGLCDHVVFPKPPKMEGTLGAVLSDAGISQLRCAETEKYPHVTFFFNDYREPPMSGEDRILIPSPRDVATYDQKPEMSAYGIRDAVVQALQSQNHTFIVVNFANPDMVGHTGDLQATIKAVEVVDACVQDILKALDALSGTAIITADHGNAEQMSLHPGGGKHTQHTLNKVECIIYGAGHEALQLKSTGKLGDIAPTILELLGLEQPAAMTGQSLIAQK